MGIACWEASDHCRAVDAVLHEGRVGEVYDVGGNNEWKNVDITRLILEILGKPESLIAHVKDRLGHDRDIVSSLVKVDRGRVRWWTTNGER